MQFKRRDMHIFSHDLHVIMCNVICDLKQEGAVHSIEIGLDLNDK